jgi:hypothetical protein
MENCTATDMALRGGVLYSAYCLAQLMGFVATSNQASEDYNLHSEVDGTGGVLYLIGNGSTCDNSTININI